MISWLLGYSWFRESIVIHEPLNCKGCTVWLFLGVELGIQWEVVGKWEFKPFWEILKGIM